MTSTRSRFPFRAAAVALALALGALALPATGLAAVTTFGSQLTEPATLDTANDLTYTGTNTIQDGTGVTIHNNHDGADTALWNTAIPGDEPTAPAAGQITSITLEGCAEQATGGPAPLTQIHFQALTPTAGGVTVDVTSQAFNIPVCGVGGASGSTQTAFAPTNFCVNAGDYVDFNDEGGFDATYYPSGVPYEVIGSSVSATMDSFIDDGGTNNGDVLLSSTTGLTNGFALNLGEQLMLQATLASGPDAWPGCPGGTKGVKAPTPTAGEPGGPPGLTIPHPQREAANHTHVMQLSVYCAQALPCTGTATITTTVRAALKKGIKLIATSPVNVPSGKGGHVAMKVTPATFQYLRKHRAGLAVTATVTLTGGAIISQPITLLL